MILTLKRFKWRVVNFLLPYFYTFIRKDIANSEVALCCIAKCENPYLKEFVTYYRKIGIDKIFIYDNNDINGEEIEDVLSQEIKESYVTIINFRGKKICQQEAYQHCYDSNRMNYAWICFFDCDEFLTLPKWSDIHTFLNQEKFKKYSNVLINWKVFGDNDTLDNDGRPVVDRFPIPLPESKLNCCVKSIVRGGLTNVYWNRGVHAPSGYYWGCSSTGDKVPFTTWSIMPDYSEAYLRHYMFKSVGEWIRIKQARGYADQSDASASQKLNLDRFWKYNKMTKEKETYISNLLSNQNYPY